MFATILLHCSYVPCGSLVQSQVGLQIPADTNVVVKMAINARYISLFMVSPDDEPSVNDDKLEGAHCYVARYNSGAVSVICSYPIALHILLCADIYKGYARCGIKDLIEEWPGIVQAETDIIDEGVILPDGAAVPRPSRICFTGEIAPEISDIRFYHSPGIRCAFDDTGRLVCRPRRIALRRKITP